MAQVRQVKMTQTLVAELLFRTFSLLPQNCHFPSIHTIRCPRNAWDVCPLLFLVLFLLSFFPPQNSSSLRVYWILRNTAPYHRGWITCASTGRVCFDQPRRPAGRYLDSLFQWKWQTRASEMQEDAMSQRFPTLSNWVSRIWVGVEKAQLWPFSHPFSRNSLACL